MDKIVIFGAAGHAQVIADIIDQAELYEVIGFLDPMHEVGTVLYGYPVLGTDEDLPALARTHGFSRGIIAIGDNWKRELLSRKILKLMPHFSFINAVHPAAMVRSSIDVGTVVMAGVITSPGTVVGSHCILNSGSILEHDCKMDDYSSIAPGTTLGGNCVVGRSSAISIGATVIHGIKIGEHSVVGAGAVVVSDIPSFTLSYGCPSKVVRKRSIGDCYL